MPETQKAQRCICEICTCGRHRCPHRPGTNVQIGDGIPRTRNSEYDEMYKTYGPLQKEAATRAARETHIKPLSGSLDGITTTKNDFIPHPLMKPQLLKRNGTGMRPQGDMDFTTHYGADYDHDYRNWPFQKPERPHHEDGYHPSSAPFEGRTTLRDDFQPVSTIPPAPYRPKTALKLGQGNLDGISSQRSDYVPHDLQRRTPVPHGDNYKPSSAPLQGESTTTADYRPWEVQRPEGRRPSPYRKPSGSLELGTTHRNDFLPGMGDRVDFNRPRTSTRLGDGQFEGLSTTKSDFLPLAGEKTQSFKPLEVAALSQDPLDGTTTIKQDYRPWEVIPPEKRRPQEYIRPDGDLDLRTTQKTDFIPITGERADINRPQTTTKIMGGNFDGSSTTKDDFKMYNVSPPKKMKPTYELPGTSGPFEDSTTTQQDYPPREITKPFRRNIKKYEKPEGDMELNTTQKADYPPLAIGVRADVNRPQTSTRLGEGEFNGTSTSQDDFKPLSSEKVQSFKPTQSVVSSDAPFDGTTTQNQEYLPWEIQKPQRRQPQKYEKPEGDMELNTTQKADYPPLARGVRADVNRPQTSTRLGEGEFNGTSTSQDDFKPLSSEKVQSFKPTQSVVSSDVPFDGTTTQNQEYLPWEIQKPQRRQPQKYEKPEGDMELNTTQKADYPPLPIRVRADVNRPQTSTRLGEGEFNGTSTSQDDFKQLPSEKVQSFKPTQSVVSSDAPFDGSTTQNQEYLPWEIQKPQRRQPQKYEKPEGDMELNTTQKADYPPLARGVRADVNRPQTSTRLGEGEFNGTSTSQDDFKQLPSEKVQSFKPTQSVVSSDAPFDGSTTQNQAYLPWEIQKPQRRQPQKYEKPEGDMEHNTTQKADYPPLPIGVRADVNRPQTSTRLGEGEFNGTSTSQDDFKQLPSEKVQSFKPTQSVVSSDAPFDGSTTQNQEYLPWEIQKPQRRQPQKYEKPEGDMEHNTTQKADYPPLARGVRADVNRPQTSTRLGEGEFNGTSTSQDDFKQLPSEKVQSFKPTQSVVSSDAPFDGTTTQSQEYLPWEIQKPQRRQPQKYEKPEGDMELNTTQKADYPPLARGVRADVNRPQTSTRLGEGEFNGTSTSQDDFKPLSSEKVQSFKPTQSVVSSDAPFDGTTTQNQEYLPWEIQKPQRRQPQKYEKPEGDMELNTTQKADYPPLPIGVRADANRPQTSTRLGEGEFNGTSTSQDDFKQLPSEKVQSFKPTQSVVSSDAPFDGSTTQNQEYLPWEIQKPQRRQPQKYEKPEGDMEHNTTQKADYPPLPIGVRADVNRPQTSTRLGDGEFNGTSTSQDDFKQLPSEKVQSFKPIQSVVSSDAPFDGSTTQNQAYLPWEIQKPQRRQPQKYEKPEGDMELNTTQKADYPPLPIGVRADVNRPQTSTRLGEGDFNGTSTSQDDFKQLPSEKVQSFKPTQSVVSSDAPFNGSTTQNQEYLPWEIQKPQRRQPQKYEKPEGDMELNTTQKADYPPLPIGVRADANRPQTSTRLGEGEFNGTSTSQDDFKQLPSEKVQSFKPTQSVVSSDAPFDGTTTQNQEYLPWEIQKPQRRQPQKYEKPEGDMELNTTQKADYPPLPIGVRADVNRPQTSTRLGEGEFNGTSTSQDDFKQLPSEKVQSFKPTQSVVSSDAPFDGTTTQNQEYLPWEIQKPQRRQPQKYEKPEGDMELNTTQKADYPPLAIGVRADANRPQTSTRLGEGEFNGTSTSQDDFKQLPSEKVQSFKPTQSVVSSDAPFDGSTTQNQAYLPWEIQKPQRRQPQKYEKPEGDMEHNTTQKADYPPLPIGVRADVNRPQTSTRLGEGEFNGTSTSQDDFKQLPSEKVQSFKPTQSVVSSDAPFDGSTTQNQEYLPWEIQKPQRRQPQKYEKPEGDMELNTTQKADYPPLARGVRADVNRPQTSTRLGEGEFNGTSTSQDDFKQLPSEKVQSFKPTQSVVSSDAPFDGSTTQNQEYLPWEIQKPQRRQPQKYEKPEGDMELNTTQKADYPPLPIGVRADVNRPQTSTRLGEGEFNGTSTSQDDFKQLPSEKVQSFKPTQSVVSSDAPFDGSTTQNQEYLPWEIQKPQRRQPQKYEKPEGDMELNTTQKADYPPLAIGVRADANRPQTSTRLGEGEFNGTSTSQDDFKQLPSEKVQSFKPTQSVVSSDAPFDGSTTQNQEYLPWEIQKPQRRQPQKYEKPEGDMEHNTTQKADYPPLPIGVRADVNRPQTSTRLGEGEFNGTSTSQDDFKQLPSEKVQSFKPTQSVVSSDAPFDGSTTQNQAYLPWEIQKPQRRQPQKYEKPEGDMEHNTTQKADYPPLPIGVRADVNRPQTSTRLGEGEFNGTSTSQDDFKQLPSEKVQSFKPTQSVVSSDAPFDGTTTQNQEYLPWEIQKPQRRQPQKYEKPEGDMELNTTQKADYPPLARGVRADVNRPQTSTRLGEGEFNGTSTSQDDFKQLPSEKVQSFKPTQSVVSSDAPFDGSTTQNQEYLPWEIQKPQRRQPQKYEKPEGDMELNTTQKADYPPLARGVRADVNRPQTSTRLGEGEFNGTSTSQDDFKQLPSEKVQSFKPTQSVVSSDAPFDGSTTQSQEYLPWEIQKPQRRQPQKYEKPEGDMELNTTQKADYPPLARGVRADVNRPQTSTRLGEGEFNGTSTSQDDFKQLPSEKVQSFKPTQSVVSSDAPFDGSTTQNQEYLPWEIQKPQRRQPQKYEKPEGDMEFNTTQKADYSPLARGVRAAVNRPQTSTRLGEGEFNGTSTSQDDFKQLPSEKVQSFKPTQSVVSSDAPFDGTTTQNQEYLPWEIQKPQRRQPQKYEKPEGDMEHNTTQKADYPPLPIGVRADVNRPQTSTRLGEGEFNGTSTSQDDFKQLPSEKVQSFKPTQSVVSSDAPFDGTTTQSEEYLPWEIQKPQRRQPQKYQKPEGDMELNTTQKADYPPLARGIRADINRPQTSTRLGEGEFNGTSTSQDDFKQLPSEKVQSFKPTQSVVSSDAPFDGSTTQNQEYLPWEIQKPQRRQPQKYEKPEGDMELNTTQKADYPPLPIGVRADVNRPQTSTRLGEGEFNGTSTSQDDFKQLPSEKVQSFKPTQSVVSSDAPFDGSTTQNQEYLPWEIQKPQRRQPQKYEKPEGDMVLSTTQKADYPPLARGVRADVNRPQTSTRLGEGEFNGTSTSQDDFKQLPSEKVQSFKPTQSVMSSDAPFDGTTTQSQEYLPWEIQKPQRRQPQKYEKPEGDMELNTTQNADYPPLARGVRADVNRPQTSTRLGEGEFNGTSTSQDDFKQLPSEKVQSFKPSYSYNMPSGKMEFTTTHGSAFGYSRQSGKISDIDFPPWKIIRRRSGSVISNGGDELVTDGKVLSSKVRGLNGDGKLSNASSDGEVSKPLQIIREKTFVTGGSRFSREKIVRPTDNLIFPSGGTFDGETTSQSHFKAWKFKSGKKEDLSQRSSGKDIDLRKSERWLATPPQKATLTEQYHPPSGPFEGNTTMRDHFHPVDVNLRARPVRNLGSNLSVSGSPFNGTTSYSQDYHYKDDVCPVVLIGTDKSDLLYKIEEGGHKFYQPRLIS